MKINKQLRPEVLQLQVRLHRDEAKSLNALAANLASLAKMHEDCASRLAEESGMLDRSLRTKIEHAWRKSELVTSLRTLQAHKKSA